MTANDGKVGETYLEQFQDSEKTIPTILTTSQKLSTGVNARNVRNIVLMRPINSIIEFKQIIGRGTRLFEGKDYFTIYDFVKAYEHFNDPAWDGEPLEPVQRTPRSPKSEEELRTTRERNLDLTFPVKCGLQAASLGKGHATSTNRAKGLGYREEFYDDVQDNHQEKQQTRQPKQQSK